MRKCFLFEHLTELNLANNRFTRLEFDVLQQVPTLKVLDISDNNLYGGFVLNANSTLETVKSIGNSFSTVGFERQTIILNREPKKYEY